MSSPPKISVVVPIHQPFSKLKEIRTAISSCSTDVELIIVINNQELVGVIKSEHVYERVVVSEKIGRGYSFITGILESQGNIILLLHSDTLLPKNWDKAITETLQDTQIIGGGFSLSFDSSNLYLKLLVYLSDLRFHLTGEIMGDRAIFVKSDVLKRCIGVLNVPLFEDVRLSRHMRQYGVTTLLPEKVVTSAEAFRKNGMIGHLWRILICRLWYKLGIDLDKIYAYYYSKNHSDYSKPIPITDF